MSLAADFVTLPQIFVKKSLQFMRIYIIIYIRYGV